MPENDDIYAEAKDRYPYDGTAPDTVLALRKAYLDGAHRIGRAAPAVECPHWEPGRITLRRGCTACAAQPTEP